MYLQKEILKRKMRTCVDNVAIRKLIKIAATLSENPSEVLLQGGFITVCIGSGLTFSMVVTPFGLRANDNQESFVATLEDVQYLFQSREEFFGGAVCLNPKDLIVGCSGFSSEELNRAIAFNYGYLISSWNGVTHGVSGKPFFFPEWAQFGLEEFYERISKDNPYFRPLFEQFSTWAIKRYCAFNKRQEQRFDPKQK